MLDYSSMKKICQLDGCDDVVYAKSWCPLHYNRIRRTGEPGPVYRKKIDRSPEDVCMVFGCERQTITRNLCKLHYERQLKHGECGGPDPLVMRFRNKAVCAIDGCDRLCHMKTWCRVHYFEFRNAVSCLFVGCDRKSFCRGLCQGHYEQWRRTGKPLKPLQKRSRPGESVQNKTKHGYLTQWDPARKKNIPVHRLIMEGHIDRFLRPDETVHHKNGIRDDNRIENLELWSTSHPRGQRVEDKLAWAYEMIKRYEGLHLIDEPSSRQRPGS